MAYISGLDPPMNITFQPLQIQIYCPCSFLREYMLNITDFETFQLNIHLNCTVLYTYKNVSNITTNL